MQTKRFENKSDEEIQNSINKQWETKIKLGTARSSSIEDSIALWLDEINIKYDMDNEIKEISFDGGFDLLREWKLKDYK